MRNERYKISHLTSHFSFLRWNLPVGLQLSVIYALLVTVTLALLGWALYAQLNNFLVQDTADRLRRITDPILNRPLPPHTPPDQVAPYVVQELSESGIDVAILNVQGQVISSNQSSFSPELASAPVLPQGWADSTRNGTSLQWIVNGANGERQLVLLKPVNVRSFPDGQTTTLFLEEITSLGSADDVLNQLRLYIALGIVVGTIIGMIAGLALTRLTLRPLDRMARTAEAIAGGDLNRRLRLPPGRNEVARLGSSFDPMVDRLASALEAQRRFVADASHELRTPLTSLEGLSEMLLMGADRGDTSVIQRSVRAMYKELARLGRLVTDLLTLSRLDSTSPMTMKPLDAGKLVAEVADQMRPLAESKQIHLLADVSQPVEVQGEPDKLKQVVLNLVDNALRYTPPEGEVRISATREPSTSLARIEVADTGPGIAPEDQARIFDRFYRADPSRARANGNTGLGLAIARAIVQAHGGMISVQSAPGMGARFTITLPSLHPAAVAPAEPATIR
jgi:two-component system OmpR family sensor kinase